jgi:hypothetical protein
VLQRQVIFHRAGLKKGLRGARKTYEHDSYLPVSIAGEGLVDVTEAVGQVTRQV